MTQKSEIWGIPAPYIRPRGGMQKESMEGNSKERMGHSFKKGLIFLVTIEKRAQDRIAFSWLLVQ